MKINKLLGTMIMVILASAFAFAYTGTGSSSDPYLLYNCSDLYETRNLNSSSYFKLNNNISCSDFRLGSNATLILASLVDFNGNKKVISDVFLYKSSGINMGLFGTLTGNIYNLILDNITVSGNISEPFPYSQTCGILTSRNTGNLDIDSVGIKFSNVSCNTAVGGFIGSTLSGSILIADSYIKNSSVNTLGDGNLCSDYAGMIGSGTRPLNIDKVYSAVEMNIAGSGSIRNAIRCSSSNDLYNTLIWANYSANDNIPNSTEAYISEMMEPLSSLWDNFTLDKWVFQDDRLPLLRFEYPGYQNIINFTGKYSYKIDGDFCNSSNYYRTKFNSPTYQNEDPIQCFDSATQTFTAGNEIFIGSAFCFDMDKGIFHFQGNNHSGLLSMDGTLSNNINPQNLFYTNQYIINTSSLGNNTYSFVVFEDNKFYNRVNFGQSYNGSVYTLTAAVSLTKCDGSMHYDINSRCIAPYSPLYGDTSGLGCHLWYNDEVTLNRTVKLTNEDIFFYNGSSFDCGNYRLDMDDVFLLDANENISHFTLKNCYINNTNPSVFSGLQFGGFNHYNAYYQVLNNSVLENSAFNDINFNTVQTYNELVIYSNKNLDVVSFGTSTKTNASMNHNLSHQYGIVNNHYLSYNKEKLSLLSNAKVDYLLMENNDIYADFFYNFLSSGHIKYNTFSGNGKGGCLGDCDSDPDIYNATTNNNYFTWQLDEVNNTFIEYNNFINVSGEVTLRDNNYYNTFRHNNFTDSGAFRFRGVVKYNTVEDNNFYYPFLYGYSGFGIYMRDGADYNNITDNRYSGVASFGLYARNSDFNIFKDNAVNLSMDDSFYSDVQDFYSPGISFSGIYINNGAHNNTFFNNSVSASYNNTVYIDPSAYDNNLSENWFYISKITDFNGGNTFYCNRYLSGADYSNITDNCPVMTSPLCYGIDNVTVFIGSTYDFNISCYDAVNISNFTQDCNNNMTFFKDGILDTSYIYQNSTVVNAAFVCAYEVCNINNNCSSFNQIINTKVKPRSLQDSNEFNSLEQAASYYFFYILWFAFILLFFLLKSHSHKPIQVFNMAQMFIGLMVGVRMIKSISFIIGFITVFIAVGLFLSHWRRKG